MLYNEAAPHKGLNKSLNEVGGHLIKLYNEAPPHKGINKFLNEVGGHLIKLYNETPPHKGLNNSLNPLPHEIISSSRIVMRFIPQVEGPKIKRFASCRFFD